MGKYKNLTGLRFGTLTPTRDAGRSHDGRVLWLCRCDCGNETVVAASDLVSGNTTNCGCVASIHRAAARRTHGQSATPLYKVWSSMKRRCSSPDDPSYRNYGGRGIRVCDEWRAFEPFCAWATANGYAPGLTLERVDNDGNYEPGNCKWIPKSAQSANTRHCRMLTYKGETHSMREWARLLCMPYMLIQSRLRHGWSVERALTEPKIPRNQCHSRLRMAATEEAPIA